MQDIKKVKLWTLLKNKTNQGEIYHQEIIKISIIINQEILIKSKLIVLIHQTSNQVIRSGLCILKMVLNYPPQLLHKLKN